MLWRKEQQQLLWPQPVISPATDLQCQRERESDGDMTSVTLSGHSQPLMVSPPHCLHVNILHIINYFRFLHMKTKPGWHVIIKPDVEYSGFLVILTDRWPSYLDTQTGSRGSIYPNVILATDKAIIFKFIHLTLDRAGCCRESEWPEIFIKFTSD